MKLIRAFPINLIFPSGTAITLGSFDGMHRGHQAALTELINYAQAHQLQSILISFEPHPREFFLQQQAPARLTKWREKWQLLQKFNLDYFCCLRFNKALATLGADEFVKKILLKQFNMKYLLVGQDFTFGHQRLGNINLLTKLSQQYHFTLAILPDIKINGERISSTKTRQALQNDDLILAQHYLGRPYTLSGHIVYGNKLGRQLGFPTINIHLNRKKTPVHGIYIVQVYGLASQPVAGVANVGERPTIDGSGRTLLEVYLLNFNQNSYGKLVTVEFLQKIRKEEHFDSLNALKTAMTQDVAIAKKYFKIK